MSEWKYQPDVPEKSRIEPFFYKQMGYEPSTNTLPPQILKQAGEALETGLSLSRPTAIVKLTAVREITRTHIHADDIAIESPLWAALAESAARPITVALFAITLGQGISNATASARERSLSQAYFLHEAGTAIIEKTADELETRIKDIPQLQGLCASRRFSPGYCDLGLYNQWPIFHFLRPETIGIELTDSYAMRPEKSITAAVLFTRHLKAVSPCRGCRNDTCAHRRDLRN